MARPEMPPSRPACRRTSSETTNLPWQPASNASDQLYACLTMYCYRVPLVNWKKCILSMACQTAIILAFDTGIADEEASVMISELLLDRASPTLASHEVMTLAEFPRCTACSLHESHGHPGESADRSGGTQRSWGRAI